MLDNQALLMDFEDEDQLCFSNSPIVCIPVSIASGYMCSYFHNPVSRHCILVGWGLIDNVGKEFTVIIVLFLAILFLKGKQLHKSYLAL